MLMQYQLLAFLSTGIYFSGLTYFKMAATDLPPLQGSRPWHLTRTLLTSRTWLTGAIVLGVGATVQVTALTGLSLFAALPMFLAGLGVLIVLAVPILGERLTLREWGCVVLLVAATVLLVRATPGTRAPAAISTPPPALIVAVALPSLLVPCIMFLASDRARKGVHARPLTGVALAINVGLLTGTSELMLRGGGVPDRHPGRPDHDPLPVRLRRRGAAGDGPTPDRPAAQPPGGRRARRHRDGEDLSPPRRDAPLRGAVARRARPGGGGRGAVGPGRRRHPPPRTPLLS